MNIKLTHLVLALVMVVATAFQALAAEYVYVTKNGKKFHHKESRFIKGKEVDRILKDEAIAKGLTPVSNYNPAPEDVTEE